MSSSYWISKPRVGPKAVWDSMIDSYVETVLWLSGCHSSTLLNSTEFFYQHLKEYRVKV